VLRAGLDQHASSTLDPQPGDQGVGSGRPGPVVGVEPSSTAVLHAEAVELLGDDPMSLVELKKRSLTDRDGHGGACARQAQGCLKCVELHQG
jgi:hypothetical protein